MVSTSLLPVSGAGVGLGEGEGLGDGEGLGVGAGVGVGASAATVAASCGSGITACQLILAGELAGLELSLYPGSYSQWCALGRPVAAGV